MFVDSFYKNIVLYMTQFWVRHYLSHMSSNGSLLIVVRSTHSSTTSPDKSHTNHGHSRSTTSSSPSSPHSSSASSINSSLPVCWIDILSFICLDSRMCSSLRRRFGCGLGMLCIIASCVIFVVGPIWSLMID